MKSPCWRLPPPGPGFWVSGLCCLFSPSHSPALLLVCPESLAPVPRPSPSVSPLLYEALGQPVPIEGTTHISYICDQCFPKGQHVANVVWNKCWSLIKQTWNPTCAREMMEPSLLSKRLLTSLSALSCRCFSWAWKWAHSAASFLLSSAQRCITNFCSSSNELWWRQGL